jgi:hypothetical protein
MKQPKKDKEEQLTCLACIGTGVIYNGKNEDCRLCNYCKGSGEVLAEVNESFLSVVINYN